MKMGIVGFIDDNFGDMILRNCLTQLMRVVMKNLNRGRDVRVISAAQPDEELVASSDVICFAGGAMFGRSPEAFAEPIGRITDIAEERGIPVIFSSIGMLESEENLDSLRQILRKSCVKAFSVREKAEAFNACAADTGHVISQVCDPALWTQAVYGQQKQHTPKDRPVIGINAVRGGLFSTYGGSWKLADEEAYLYQLAENLDKAGFDCRFFSNGQTLDCNVLRHFAEKYQIPDEKLICPDTSAELVNAIAGFDAVAAVRMHASIVAYALGVPSVNLVWNDKIRDFYDYIGRPERVITPDDAAAEKTAELVIGAIAEDGCAPDPQRMMSVYAFLYEAMRGITGAGDIPMYGYDQVCGALRELSLPDDEQERDLRIKIRRGEIRYASLFRSDLTQKAKVRKLNRELKDEKKKADAAKVELRQAQEELTALKQQNRKMQGELDYLHSRPVVKAYLKLARQGQKLKAKKS